MFDIESYISILTDKLKEKFGDRLIYVGLQGSYLRGEANENSDIDIMAVIDSLSVEDLNSYRQVLKEAGSFEKACGFICGKAELKNWNPLEVFHLLNTTKDIYGELSGLVPEYTEEDERNYVKVRLGDLYHEICHRYIYADMAKNTRNLPLSFKTVFFILQHIYYMRSGRFIATKHELLSCLEGEDRDVLEMSIALQKQEEYDPDKAFSVLFGWCGRTIPEI